MKTIRELYEELQKDAAYMDLAAPVKRTGAYDRLPSQLQELLDCFNGGEIYVPGTVIYGLSGEQNLKWANNPEHRARFHLPSDAMVIGKENFGDLICLKLRPPCQVIQWDHERDCEFRCWDSLASWLAEEIAIGRQLVAEMED